MFIKFYLVVISRVPEAHDKPVAEAISGVPVNKISELPKP